MHTTRSKKYRTYMVYTSISLLSWPSHQFLFLGATTVDFLWKVDLPLPSPHFFKNSNGSILSPLFCLITKNYILVIISSRIWRYASFFSLRLPFSPPFFLK